jgi:hypothetical protein
MEGEKDIDEKNGRDSKILAENYPLELLSLISAYRGHNVHLLPFLMITVPTSKRGLPSFNE